MPSEPVRWGFLAASSIAATFVRDVVLSGGVPWAVGSRDLEKAEGFAAAHGVGRAYGSYDELVADPAIDVVYVSSPHSLHHAHARLALEAGKAVVVEKPFAMTAAEGEDLVALARERGLFLMEAMWTRCSPLTRRLAGRIADGHLGEVRSLSVTLGPVGVTRGHRALDATLGGGVLLEGLVYAVALIDQLAPQLGEPTIVQGVASFTAGGADDATSVLLGYPGGASAVLSSAFVDGAQGVAASRAHVSGSSGWAELPGTFFNPSRLLVSAGGSPVETLELADNRDYGYEIDEVHRCLAEGLTDSPLVPLNSTIGVARILDRIGAALTANRALLEGVPR